MQKRLTVCLLLLLQLSMGCQSSIPKSDSSPASIPKQESASASGSHIDMPVRDMTIEMQKHCTAASRGFEKVKGKIDAALLHGGVDEVNYKMKKLSPELKTVQEDMEKCRQMAHGIYEKSVGVEPPK